MDRKQNRAADADLILSSPVPIVSPITTYNLPRT